MFQGAAQLSLDAKGRLVVPTRHRDRLLSESQSKLVLTAHPHRCLLLYPAPAWEPIRARMLGFSSFDPQTSLWKRLLVGFAEELELDASGRVLVSPELRKFAGIDRQVMMVGQGSHFEVWSTEAWDAQLATLGQSDTLPPGMENFAL
ncbi:MAG: division/cell wall cluster transcriptional repressor MraZ [Burkholderiales bacterium]|jgi:MraZ protein|nr:division/cell wall cluster transcriptional repressor MraZ [Burkholderiales bacterium]MBX9961600.1 division/cell wall cluster transcriptional repressor MraZ [Burkholderiales bacterium]